MNNIILNSQNGKLADFSLVTFKKKSELVVNVC